MTQARRERRVTAATSHAVARVLFCTPAPETIVALTGFGGVAGPVFQARSQVLRHRPDRVSRCDFCVWEAVFSAHDAQPRPCERRSRRGLALTQPRGAATADQVRALGVQYG
jgi:hypothetical protein